MTRLALLAAWITCASLLGCATANGADVDVDDVVSVRLTLVDGAPVVVYSLRDGRTETRAELEANEEVRRSEDSDSSRKRLVFSGPDAVCKVFTDRLANGISYYNLVAKGIPSPTEDDCLAICKGTVGCVAFGTWLVLSNNPFCATFPAPSALMSPQPMPGANMFDLGECPVPTSGTTGTTSTGTTSTGTTGTTSTGVVAVVNREGKRFPRYAYQSAGGISWNQGVPATPIAVPTAPLDAGSVLDTSLRGRDDVYAKTVLAPGQITNTLNVVRFSGDNIPTGATVTGIKWIITRFSNFEGLKDISMQLVIGGAPDARTRKYTVADPSAAWSTKEANVRVGGPTDLWGLSPAELTPAVVNGLSFGLALQTKNLHATRSIEAWINEVTLVVAYTVPAAALLDSDHQTVVPEPAADTVNLATGPGTGVLAAVVAAAAVAVAAVVVAGIVVRLRRQAVVVAMAVASDVEMHDLSSDAEHIAGPPAAAPQADVWE